MQTIIKTSHSSNFTILANDLISSDIPPTPKAILLYLLSKPSSWQLKSHDLRKQLGLTAYAIKKGLRWLCLAGFAAYTRLKTGHTIWRIFDKPQVSPQEKAAYSPTIQPQVEIPQVENRPVLIKTETELRNKPLPTPPEIPEPIQKQHVVVDSELIYPPQLNPEQKKAAKRIIKKIKNPELTQDILFELAYIITSGNIKKSVPACLHGLVTSANENGYFIRTQAIGATKQGGKPLVPIWQGFGQSTPSKPEKAKGFIQQARSALRGIAI